MGAASVCTTSKLSEYAGLISDLNLLFIFLWHSIDNQYNRDRKKSTCNAEMAVCMPVFCTFSVCQTIMWLYKWFDLKDLLWYLPIITWKLSVRADHSHAPSSLTPTDEHSIAVTKPSIFSQWPSSLAAVEKAALCFPVEVKRRSAPSLSSALTRQRWWIRTKSCV